MKQNIIFLKISRSILRFLAVVLLLLAASSIVGYIFQYKAYYDELCRREHGPPSFCMSPPKPDPRLITWGIGFALIDIPVWLGYFWVRKKVKTHA